MQTISLHARFLRAGIECDRHESDLYVRDTPAAWAIIADAGEPHTLNAKAFTADDDSGRWIDVPFMWDAEAAAKPDHQHAKEALAALMDREALTITATFVPFSRSRNAKEAQPSLNWTATLVRQHRPQAVAGGVVQHGSAILSTDYSAGAGHAPSYKPEHGRRTVAMQERAEAVATECETGFPVKWWNGSPQPNAGPDYLRGAILPDQVDVFASLVGDASVIDYASFEVWAAEYGYDSDSRKAEATYRACLEIALALRNGIGEAVLQQASDMAARL